MKIELLEFVVFWITFIIENNNAKDIMFHTNAMLANMITTENRLSSVFVQSTAECGVRCGFTVSCVSFFIKTSPGMCYLHTVVFNSYYPMTSSSGWNYYARNSESQQKLPTTCEDIQACGITQDGDYTIYPIPASPQTAVTVYCYSMSGNPTEYISVHYPNYVQAKELGTGCNSSITLIRNFSKVRINITNWQIDRNDFTFSTSTTNTILPFGKVEDCIGEVWKSCVRPISRIDLRGTGFVVKDTVVWYYSGFAAGMQHQKQEGGAIVHVECLAYCGFCDITGGVLELEYTGTNVTGVAQVVAC